MEGDNKFITQDIVKHQLYQTTIFIIINIITTELKNQLKHTKTVSWMYKHRDKQKSVWKQSIEVTKWQSLQKPLFDKISQMDIHFKTYTHAKGYFLSKSIQAL